MSKILEYLKEQKLAVYSPVSTDFELKLEFDLRVKPGSKFEKIEIDPSTSQMVIKTQKRPIEGAANDDIIEKISDLFHVAKNNVGILRGEKSKIKRIQVHLIFSKQKPELYFLERIKCF